MGCMGLGGGWDNNPIATAQIQQAHTVIDTCLEQGINLFDHADIYTLGKAEQVFGQVLAERGDLRQQIFIQSKCGIRIGNDDIVGQYDFSKNYILQQADSILARLNTDYIDCLLLHRPDCLMDIDEVAQALTELKNSGKVRFFGVSNMDRYQMEWLQSALDFPLVANQLELSLSKLDWLNQGVEVNVNTSPFASGTLQYCQQHKVQIQAWGCLSQGLFTGRDISQQSLSVQNTALYVAQLATLYQASKEAIVLAWLMRHPAGIQPVIGTTNPSRIAACVEATQIELSREEWYKLYVMARGQALP
ncbi:aldo/keto reductase [Saccharobesus litoralis]|uniref:Aldo/keto reductase n=2 Tax=Saccharobesus litoralis TaxID=2172099 RepID=A0A2S0VY14_9ALTE|nr:aldo/keto reductase [Saccharobesus litoralis]